MDRLHPGVRHDPIAPPPQLAAEGLGMDVEASSDLSDGATTRRLMGHVFLDTEPMPPLRGEDRPLPCPPASSFTVLRRRHYALRWLCTMLQA